MSIQLAYFPFDDVGAISSLAKIDVVSASAISHSVTSGKKGVSLENTGDKVTWYGGSNVDPANKIGNRLWPTQILHYKNVKTTFDLYFRCAAGDTTDISPVEYS